MNLKSHDTPDGSNGVDLKHRDVVRTMNAMVIHSVGRTRREPPEKTTEREIVFTSMLRGPVFFCQLQRPGTER